MSATELRMETNTDTPSTPEQDRPIHFRISSDLNARAMRLAKAEQRSLSNFFRLLITEGVERREKALDTSEADQ